MASSKSSLESMPAWGPDSQVHIKINQAKGSPPQKSDKLTKRARKRQQNKQ